MDRKKKIFLCAAAIVVLLAAVLLFGQYRADGLADNSIQTSQQTAARGWETMDSALTLYQSEEGFLTGPDATLSGNCAVSAAGEYEVWIRYAVETETYMELALTLELAGSHYDASASILWSENAAVRPLDRYGDEMNVRAELATYPVVNPLIRSNDVAARTLTVTLKEGEQAFSLFSNLPVRIYGVYLLKPDTVRLADTASEGSGKNLIVIEAEKYALKSDSYIRGKNVKNPALAPYDTYQEKINVVDAGSWSTVGQKILWVVNVEQGGWYRIGFRYSQYSEANKFSYRTIVIDGAELTDSPVAFPSTGMNAYKNLTVSDENGDVWVYLEAGEHTLSMRAVMDPLINIYQQILTIMQEVNAISMDLRKLTAGNLDENRTWDMDQYLPEVPGKLEQCRVNIQAVYDALAAVEGVEPSYANQLLQAVVQLDNLLEDQRLIPNKAGILSEGDGSINSSLGSVLEKLVHHPLSLDRIYLYQNVELPKSGCSVLVSASESLKRLAETYLPGAGNADYTAADADTGELQVWVNMSISYAEVLQQMIDESYNPDHGTRISIALMPNEQKLILSNATNSNPDVVLGVNFFTPYELAIRGAAKDLLEYEDFGEYYASQYNIAGLTPLAYDGGIYGAVDSLNYQVLFYRKDILDSLGLEVPKTWDDVQNMMPVLLRYSMNFYTTLSGGSSFKTFNMTGPFIYQNGGTFYAEDGASVAFQEGGGQEGLLQMTELFRIYSLTEATANFFNSFRYGEIPVGVGNFSTYIQLMTAAPELEGQWGIALIPGQLQSDGSISYYQAADSTASMIFKNTDMPEEAWEFLKWWLSSEVQAEFSNRLERTYGPAYRWNTANLQAFASLPYPEEHKAVILEQVSYQMETARHPAGYMVEREVSNIWNEVVVNGKGLTESIDRAVIASNREIIRKLKEFGFIDENGNLIQSYTTEDVRQWLHLQEGDEAG